MNKGTQIRWKSFCLSTRFAHSFSTALPLSRPLCFIAWMKLLHHYYLFIVMIALYCSQRYPGDLLRFIADNISASKLHTIENNVWHGSNLRNILPTLIYRSNSSRTRFSRSKALNSKHRHTVCAECQKTWFAKITFAAVQKVRSPVWSVEGSTGSNFISLRNFRGKEFQFVNML